MRKTTKALLVAASVGVPAAFAAFVWISYAVAFAQGELPFLAQREWRWWVVFGVALMAGVACIVGARTTTQRRIVTVVLAVGYVVVMAVILAAIGFGVACNQGDCI